ncbi:MAG: inositol monophosphatase family protein [Patescibacteria group bacterium]
MMDQIEQLLHICSVSAALGSARAFELTKTPDMARLEKNGDELSLKNVDQAVQLEMAEAIRAMAKQHAIPLNIKGEDIDPIITKGAQLTVWLDCPDGTQNSVTFHRDFVSLVSVFDGDKPVISVIDNPAMERVYRAVAGRGSRVLHHQLPRSDRYKNFPVILTDWPWLTEKKALIAQFMGRLVGERLSFRMYGSAGYEATLVAEGQAAAMVHTDLKIWEFAITLLISEAGGTVWFKRVSEDSFAVVASMDHQLHDKLVKEFEQLV